jgi:hypothetical protein
MISMLLMCLCEISLEKIIALHVGPHHKGSNTYVWVHKCLVTNLRGLNQTWVPKTKA